MPQLIEGISQQFHAHNGDEYGNQQGSEIFHSAVSERMPFVGRLCSHAIAEKSNQAVCTVRQVIERIGENRNRAGKTSGKVFDTE